MYDTAFIDWGTEVLLVLKWCAPLLPILLPHVVFHSAQSLQKAPFAAYQWVSKPTASPYSLLQ